MKSVWDLCRANSLTGSAYALLLATAGCAGSQTSSAGAQGGEGPRSEPRPHRNVIQKQDNEAVAAPDDLIKSNASNISNRAGTDSAAAKQQRAVDACHRASELLHQGDVVEALARVDEAYGIMLTLPDDSDTAASDGLEPKEEIRRLAAELIAKAYDPHRVDDATARASWDRALPVRHNEHVQREIGVLLGPERESFLAAYRRSGRYRPMILKALEEAGLPSQLSWLPLVESWFKVRALSRAGALGIWQFISSTGLRFGLRRDQWIDERLDPIKSTHAAIDYLTRLHGLFGDWPKALAAYNCGEGRVRRLQGLATKDQFQGYWDLFTLLPKETRRYFPRLIAALLIIQSPEEYDITLPPLDDPWPGTVRTVTVEHSVKLEALEQALELQGGALSSLNPELRYAATPKTPYSLRVPPTLDGGVAEAAGQLPEWQPPRPEFAIHRVQSGDTLSSIAERYRSSVSAIMRSNRLRDAHRIWPGQKLRIPLSS